MRTFAGMKRHLLIGLLLLLLALAACHTPTREARRMVKRAELLADTLPDSTVCLIDSVLRSANKQRSHVNVVVQTTNDL